MAARMHISWPRMGTCEHANTVHKYQRERERETPWPGTVTETEYLNLDPTIFDIPSLPNILYRGRVTIRAFEITWVSIGANVRA